MAESYNAIAIKMGIDTSQFDAGLNRTRKQIDDVAARMAKTSEENRRRARMAEGMAGMGVGDTPEDRRLSRQLATRLKINQIINQQNELIEEEIRLAAAAEGRVQIRKMLNDEEEKTNAILAFQNKQRKDLVAFQKQLDAAEIRGQSRQKLIQEFQALQAATKAQWEKGNAHKYTTELERKAEAIKGRLVTAEQRHAATLLDLKKMLQQTLLTQEQYAAAVKQEEHALAMQKGGFGRMAGAATQASFAIEDFIQVMSMGGGLNMALMSASNNLTMVIRSLNLFKGALGTVAMFGLPLLAVGVTSAIGYFAKASKATDRWKAALEDLERTWKNSGWREMARLELKDFGRQIESSSSDQLTKRENDLLAEQEKLKAILFQQDMERTRKNQELFMGLVGGQKAYAEMLEYTNKAIREGGKADKQRAIQLQNLMSQAQKHAIEGRAESAIASLREMLGLMEEFSLGVQGIDINMFDGIKSLFNDPAMMDALQSLLGATTLEGGYGFESDIEQLNAFRDELLGSETNLTEEQKRQLQITEELLKLAQEKQKAVEREAEAARQLAKEQKMTLDAKRQEMMFNMTATEEDKAAAKLEKQMQEFVFGDTGIMGPTLDQLKAGQEFLLAAQQQTQQQIEKLQTFTSPEYLGELQQDAFEAQAEAFKQIDKARQEKPNPQLERQINLLNRINDALRKGTPLVIAGGP